ncbi:MAG TPA: phosphatase PAP2 family protein [Mycobacteriales bacterium]|nr:phosphatase PAP2 family protein [Mycobacteriales bacterium]
MKSRGGAWLQSADQALFGSAARWQPRGIDAVVPRLTRAADHGLLWAGVAATLAVIGGERERRAALRGLVSLGLASAVANGPVKWAVRRPRPGLESVPAIRQLVKQPRTSSFPSGHSASAAAFATGVALESPVAAVPIALLAGGVAYGRVHTGVHYPSDVAVGILLGAGCALAVRRSWPTRPPRAVAAAAPAGDAPALPDGRGLVAVVNAASGPKEDADELRSRVLEELPAAEVVICGEGEDIVAALEDAAGRADVLGVAGGDGTVNAAAGSALRRGIPLAIFPAGTLNHFAADLGVCDVDDTIRALRAGDAVEVAVATAGPDLEFLNTFSIGLYPDLVRRREARERVVGKWPALALALAEVLGRAAPTTIELDGEQRDVWLLFGGNGRYHPDGFAPSWRERLDEGVVDIRVVDANHRWARTRLVAAVLTGRLGRCRVYSERAVHAARLRFVDEPTPRLARDGEWSEAPEELTLTVADRQLVVYRPAAP